MNKVENVVGYELDVEWVNLILEAKQLGLSPEEVQSFLAKGAVK